jgi:hypothetical protein
MDKKYSFKDYTAHEKGNSIRVIQDIEPHLEWAKHQRELSRNNKFSRKDTGFKPFCNVPDSIALDIMTKYGINIHDKNIQPEEMRKFKRIIKTDYPHLMYY